MALWDVLQKNFFDTLSIAKSQAAFLHRWRRWLIACVLLLIGGFILLSQKRTPQKEVAVSDVTQSARLAVNAEAWQKHVYAVSLHIYGQLDGSATLLWASQTQHLNGVFDVKVERADWYLTNMVISYYPTGVTRGSVLIQYDFLD